MKNKSHFVRNFLTSTCDSDRYEKNLSREKCEGFYTVIVLNSGLVFMSKKHGMVYIVGE
jgi:hypothetical protein